MISFLIALFSLALISFFTWKKARKQPPHLRFIFWTALLVKVGAGIVLGLIYAYYYGDGDTVGFYQDAGTLYELFHNDPYAYFDFLWDTDKASELVNQLLYKKPRSLFFVKTVSLVSLIAHHNYWLISFYFSWVSFMSAWHFVSIVSKKYPSCGEAIFIAFLFFPSVVLWSSGIVKESLAMASLLFLAASYFVLMHKKKMHFGTLSLLILALFFLWNLKYYWAALFLPCCMAGLVAQRIVLPIVNRRSPLVDIGLWAALFLMFVLGVSITHPNLYADRFLFVLTENNRLYAMLFDQAVDIHFADLNPSWESILYYSPWALVSGLFRPLFMDGTTVFRVMASLENTALITLVLYVVYRLIRGAKIAPFSWPLLCSMIAYSMLLCVFLALSTPNLGALSRYRIGFFPFVVFLLLYQSGLGTLWRCGFFTKKETQASTEVPRKNSTVK